MPEGDAPSPKAVEQIAEWLAPLPRPVGVFCFNDAVARAVAEACADISAVIPDDIAIGGVDNDDIQLGFSAIALSSIELNRRRLGFIAAGRMLAMVADSTMEAETLRVSPLKIVARGSTDKLAVNDEAVAEALDYIADQLGNTIYVEEIARAVGVSRRSLEMRFKAALKTSVYAEVQRQQLERAEVLLMENPKLTIAEVAFACGFQDARHLSVVCRRRLNCTPGSLRVG
ncbi:MAG: helix-turn-helix domain-containing protein [Candidatus Synoicihabitans palmerolidicus]|nr:helix-turn-helix domain-containing protein [Candidatus Synoicihabitans palmerolidicus]